MDTEAVPPAGALVTRTTVRDLVALFEFHATRIRAAFAMCAQAEDALNAVYTLGEASHKAIHVTAAESWQRDDWRAPEAAIERVARTCWACIVDRLEIRKVMSASRAKALDERLERGALPDLTEANVYAFAAEYSDVDNMFNEKIREVFAWLRPGEHAEVSKLQANKRNARLEIGPKVVKGRVVSFEWGRFKVDYDDTPHLTALEALFRALDGRGFGTKGHESDLEAAIKASRDGIGETEYFAFRAHKNTNLHITFRRLDLLAELNRRAGGLNLRPGMRELDVA